MSTLIEYVLPPLITAGAALIIALLAYLTQLVKTKTSNTTITGIVDRARNDIDALVSELAQRADNLRDPVTGVLTLDNAALLKNDAINKFRAIWGEAGIRQLMKILGFDELAFAQWLSAQIERLVRSGKSPITTTTAFTTTSTEASDQVSGISISK